MNHLRKIMQKLAQTDAKPERQPDLVKASAAFVDILRRHVEEYQQRLDDCSSAMLQYEWAWLIEHIADLELCLSQPEMLQTAGGKAHVEHLLLESQHFQAVLNETMQTRGVEPARQAHAVATGEHAWEISQEAIKRLWGIDYV
ncbi:MAG: hypothetical protein VKO39_14190 [Cyanobacteriota bacterium]|nr:hypothetical protein [Cyanobacteriota bacterium]